MEENQEEEISDYNPETKKKINCWMCITCCFGILLMIACFYAPVFLNRALRKTYTLNTTGFEYELFNLSTT